MRIYRATKRHFCVHIGHRHPKPRRVIRQRLSHAELIKVARVVVVDGKPAQVAQVANSAVHLNAGLSGRFGFLQHFRRKSRQQAPAAHGTFCDLVEVDWVHKVPEGEAFKCTRRLR